MPTQLFHSAKGAKLLLPLVDAGIKSVLGSPVEGMVGEDFSSCGRVFTVAAGNIDERPVIALHEGPPSIAASTLACIR